MAELSRLLAELDKCRSLRETLAKRLAEAREQGDLAVNAAYAAARVEMDANERRITEIGEAIGKMMEE